MIDGLLKLVDSKLDELNTVALGIVTQVDLSKLRCNVKLKNRVQGNEIELFDVPIAVQKFDEAKILLAPKEKDIVLVLFSKYELEEQLKNKDIVDVNELLKFNLNNALIIAGIFTLTDEIPPMEEGQVLLQNGNQKVLFDRKNKLISVENDSTSVDIDAAANTVTVNAQTVVINGQTVTISGDLRFSKIMGVDASKGVWHKHV